MIIKASNYKNWCTENISPQAWTRIILRCMSEIREKGMSIKEMEELKTDVELDPKLLEALNKALDELYEMNVDESLLVRY